MGKVLLQLGTPLQVLYLCGVHPLWWSQRFFVDACIWDDFLVTSAVLELSTLASLLFCYDSENASFRVAP